jgi:hypothetical protein
LLSGSTPPGSWLGLWVPRVRSCTRLRLPRTQSSSAQRSAVQCSAVQQCTPLSAVDSLSILLRFPLALPWSMGMDMGMATAVATAVTDHPVRPTPRLYLASSCLNAIHTIPTLLCLGLASAALHLREKTLPIHPPPPPAPAPSIPVSSRLVSTSPTFHFLCSFSLSAFPLLFFLFISLTLPSMDGSTSEKC